MFARKFLIIWLISTIWSTACIQEKKIHRVQSEITNPILPGFYPDPSICRGENGYYMVNSTFGYFPGIPIFFSDDMVHWQQIGHALTRPSQLQIEGQNITSRGTYAPTIEYHKGTYYITCTEVGNRGNYIVTAKDPAGSWSELNLLPEIIGIDPSLFFDEDGKTYIVYNSDAPANAPEYEGHRTIRINEIDIEEMKVVGEDKILVNGGADITQKPVWIEGPHMYKVNDKYYLSAAEGGTSTNHSQVIFRSEKITGPFIPWDKNPILTQRDLDPQRPEPITSTGHADMIQDLNGDWWALFLGCRPYSGNHYNTGRETFMAPVRWEDGWPIINPNHKAIQKKYPFGAAMQTPENYTPLNGNVSRTDEFTTETLGFEWLTIRSSDENWYHIDTLGSGTLKMQVLPFDYIHTKTPSFIGRRQQHQKSVVETQLSFTPQTEADKAGLVVFQDPTHFYFISQSIKDNNRIIQLIQSDGEAITIIETKQLSTTGDVELKIESDVDAYRFYFSDNQDSWNQIGGEQDASRLSTHTAGGFTGCFYGMYAFTNQEKTNLSAEFNWFKYTGYDTNNTIK